MTEDTRLTLDSGILNYLLAVSKLYDYEFMNKNEEHKRKRERRKERLHIVAIWAGDVLTREPQTREASQGPF